MKVAKSDKFMSKLQDKLDLMAQELKSTASQLRDATQRLEITEKQGITASRQLAKVRKAYDVLQDDFMHTELEKEKVEEDNKNLRDKITSLEDEIEMCAVSENVDFSFETKTGKQYSPTIRKLYYTLLADQVPPGKIATIIRSVLKCFVPDVDASSLKLPASRCAGYMRREELKTVSMAHKASILSEDLQAGKKTTHTDGTTKNQRKLNGTAFNGIVLSVNEVQDGTAETVIREIEKELEKLRIAARQLNLPNANSINWSLFSSSWFFRTRS